ncbi:Bug family tripartite tricarboxylate transporter substrate binding protein [Alphaproteobacteria bacterium LSUCC0719]|jgi:putative tricarboxylic transport membrane protein
MLSKKKILSVGIGIASMAGVMAMSSAPVVAAEGTIEVVTHAGAGGGTDVNARMMMIRTRRALEQDMVVVNKRGGGGAAAMNYFKTRPADGNSILMFTVGHAITMAAGKTNLTLDEMAPLGRGTNDPQILMVNCKTTKYKTPEEFVAGVKAGDKLTYGGTQSGTIDHITVYLWAKAMGQPMPNYVPFGGGAELATQLVAGAVDVGTLNLSEASSQVESGDICPMVILDRNPMAPIPQAKTSIEMGIDLELATVRGYATHSGVDKARRDELEAGMMKAMNHSLYQAYLTNSGLDSTSPMGAEEWGKQMKMMVNEFGPALKEMGLVQ